MRISDWSADVCSSDLLVGRALAGRRDRVVLATKFGNVRLPDGTRTVDARPEHAVEACEKSLKRLGVEVIDLFYLHRMDRAVPIEDTVGAMAKLVEAGKVRYLGLSEAGAGTLERARSEEHTSELQSLMRNSYAVFCLQKQKT